MVIKKIIKISEFRFEQTTEDNKNENKNLLNNNKDLINRLKNQSCSLKPSIINKNQNNINKTSSTPAIIVEIIRPESP